MTNTTFCRIGVVINLLINSLGVRFHLGTT
jgi:type III secretory pathway component EscR